MILVLKEVMKRLAIGIVEIFLPKERPKGFLKMKVVHQLIIRGLIEMETGWCVKVYNKFMKNKILNLINKLYKFIPDTLFIIGSTLLAYGIFSKPIDVYRATKEPLE